MKNIFVFLSVWLIFISSSHQSSSFPLSKRSARYEILESPGLHSHFFRKVVQDQEVLKANLHRRRNRRSVEGRQSELHSDEIEDVEDSSSRRSSDDVSVENMPLAEKQRMNNYRSDDSRLMDKWVKAPYGDAYQSRSQNEGEDVQSEASANVGIKARTPRVNFITQQGQSTNSKDEPEGPEAREKERERVRDQQTAIKQTSEDTYRKPERYYPSSYPNKAYDPYASPNYIQPYDRYGPSAYYGREPLPYYPYRERELAYNERPPHGMNRLIPPAGASSSLYYRHQYNDDDEYFPRTIPNSYYSDKRFDTHSLPMEPRDPYQRELYRPYLYTNEVNRPGRIIYYANLPEIVRTPGNYRSATARYGDPMYNDYYYNNNYDDSRSARTAKSVTYRDSPPSTTTMRISSDPVRSDTARERSYYG